MCASRQADNIHPQLLNVQVPLFFKEIIDTLNIPLDAQSTVWVICGSVVLACMSHCLLSALKAEPIAVNDRRCGAHRCDTFRRIAERSIRERRSARSPHRRAPNVWASAQPRPQIPSFSTNWRTHAGNRPRNQVRSSPLQIFLCFNSLSLHVLQGRYVHPTVYIVPSRAYSA